MPTHCVHPMNVKDAAIFQSFAMNWNRTEVLRWATMLAPERKKDVIMGMSTAISSPAPVAARMVHLPQDLLCRWLESLAPKLDLRDDDLSVCKKNGQTSWLLTMSTVRVSHMPTVSMTHITLGVQCPSCAYINAALEGAPKLPITQAIEDPRVLLKLYAHATATNQKMQCQNIACGFGCGARRQSSAMTHVIVGRICGINGCVKFMPANNCSQHVEVPDLKTIDMPQHTCCIQNLVAISGFGAHMSSLQHLGLHDILLSMQVAHSLRQLLGSLPHNVTTLTLDFLLEDSEPTSNAVLFHAIAKMLSLRQLRMTQWEKVVGEDAAACVVPLMGLPHLLASLVNEQEAALCGFWLRLSDSISRFFVSVIMASQLEFADRHNEVSTERSSSRQSCLVPKTGICNCTVSFENDCVRVVATQPEDVTFEQKQENASALTLCWQHLSVHPPNSFKIQLLGGFSSPQLELCIEHSLVEKLPLLQDVATNSDASGSDVPLQLSSSIWGLVSLLVILEGDVTVQQWFEGAAGCNPAASLPAQTLEAACYMDCVTVKRDVVAWLQQVLTQVVNAYSGWESQNSSEAMAMQQFSNTWELTEVVRWTTMVLPQSVRNEVMNTLTADSTPSEMVGKLVHLPQDLLCAWLECLAPLLDLRESGLSRTDLLKLLACLPSMAAHSMQELHVSLSADTDSCMVPNLELENLPTASFGMCRTSRHDCRSDVYTCEPTHLSLGGQCYNCGDVGAAKHTPVVSVAEVMKNTWALEKFLKLAIQSNNMLQNIHLSCSACDRCTSLSSSTHVLYGRTCAYESCRAFTAATNYKHVPLSDLVKRQPHAQTTCLQDLSTLGGLAKHLPSLQHLGLHSIALSLGTIQNLGQLLGSLPHNVTTLTLSILPGDVTVAVKVLLCKAIARMRSLRQLCMPQWEEVVGRDAAACVVPLKGLPHLEAVFVAEVKDSNAFPAGFCFKPLEANA